ncbi:cell division/cell wall cluster transcriptional repressor MraZ [Candidatus Azambacteria bacterium RIFCSPHIGHO2_01_FULL_44_55]|uniref:Transcriptional regulator MraZ n=1 Tax=Candidatus Azambacteria bacterium RIFCSPLOWO2_02_FULL_44_14 TaxID=1797306 RepID=A0A1F5C9T1_9BACT|nr:MAG: cell division/cell wall cluster transcriptional repressor MraZ [Candidatus Azambacteria bacterium RIFCSPLOWO2_01_FULL_44_84]OGD33139.1 MAG: cell division/cell wall cluster transcriptional repressor MraZ [Candidatus Azambacteria bacterium RIFCSPHIGHO2_02_FULL_45_18]OGD39617.1 MAG: cell division/cell wall cluster transcriptional repressor MraZ [Candidatus Azambacteria bacterium RIFCSPLOWO2_02_FULL_44_14]OGD39941.1 MAG: cell division/cell wall cluster transcriptional repressor MraZ [Candida
MLLGEYRHNLDSKNRLTIPAKLRMELGEKPILTRGLDNCLFIYPRRDWELFVEKLSQLPLSQKTARNFSRFMLSGASEAEIDEMGRILVPDFLRKYGRFEKTIVVVGVQNRVEIWAEKEWGKYMTEIEKSSGDIAENLSGFGI